MKTGISIGGRVGTTLITGIEARVLTFCIKYSYLVYVHAFLSCAFFMLPLAEAFYLWVRRFCTRTLTKHSNKSSFILKLKLRPMSLNWDWSLDSTWPPTFNSSSTNFSFVNKTCPATFSNFSSPTFFPPHFNHKHLLFLDII